jgi:hypothetical protein
VLTLAFRGTFETIATDERATALKLVSDGRKVNK